MILNTKKSTAIMWFRQDLRLIDNPALNLALAHENILPLYILDTHHAKKYQMGAASKVWLHHSLIQLNQSLNYQLNIYAGDPLEIIKKLISQYDSINAIYWNRCYEPWQIARDKKIKNELTTELNVTAKSTNGSLLWEPWDIKKTDGTFYKVFTPYYRKGCLGHSQPRMPIEVSSNYKEQLVNKLMKVNNDFDASLNQLNLLPKTVRWDEKMIRHWHISEEAAFDYLNNFLEVIEHYKTGRNFPSKPYISKLSPFLHFGQISPHYIWHKVNNIHPDDANTDCFCSELGWREFSYYQLYHQPSLPTENLQKKFDHFPWIDPKLDQYQLLTAWQTGQTGIPLVDAGMRELWETGYMHNRVRMIVGSFLVKNLRLHWHHGESWFWDSLFDADLASNSASWQWVAGCGADAAPYFRIFNPVTQGQRFDPEGEYIRKFIPELAKLSNKYIFNPWEAPDNILRQAGIILGKNYPRPIVDLKISRAQALEAFKLLKES